MLRETPSNVVFFGLVWLFGQDSYSDYQKGTTLENLVKDLGMSLGL